MKVRQLLNHATGLALLAVVAVGCSEGGSDDNGLDPVIANFEAAVDGNEVTFTNNSLNADTYSWDFGDETTSTDENPVHTYASTGEYDVVLTASMGDDVKVAEKKVIIEDVDPLTALTGGSSKTWVLAPIQNAISFGNPARNWPDNDESDDESEIVELWWGNFPDQVEGRACLFDNEFTFSMDGSYNRETNGAIWKEWKVFDAVSGEGCTEDGEELLSRYQDEDVTAWRDGSFSFEIDTWSGEDTIFNYTLTTTGMGAYIGHYVSGTNTSDYSVHDGSEYGVLSISQDTVKLISYGWGGDDMDPKQDNPDYVHDPNSGSRWYKVVLVPKAE